MSAYLVSQNHINALVCFHMEHCGPTDTAMTRVLTEENMRSLRYRYEDVADWQADADSYAFERVSFETVLRDYVSTHSARMVANGLTTVCSRGFTRRETMTAMVKLCDCYDYQACEHDEYETSKAKAFVERIRAKALAMGGKDSGSIYDAMPWGL